MPAVNRYYSSVAVDTTLSFSISSSDLTLTVGSTAGFPTSYPYTLALGYNLSNEELVTIVAASGTTLTVGTTVAGGANIAGRGVDGTNDQAHAAGEAVKHVISARDMTESQAHIAAEADVHGLATAGPSGASGGTIVGTTASQTLTNKTITGGTVNPTTLQQGGVAAVTTTGTQTLTNKTITSPAISDATITGTTTATSGTIALGTNASAITANSTTISATEVGYLDGVTSAIQTQINTANTTITNNTPVGVVNMWVTGTAPTGWLLCQGQTLNSVTNPEYAALWGVIGTTYGGTGNTSFKLPDLRGRVPMGAGTGRNVADSANLTARTLGAKVSDAETHTLTHAEIPSVAAASHVHYHASPISLQSGAAMVLNMSDSTMDSYGGSYEVTGTANIFSTNIGFTSSQAVEQWLVTSSAPNVTVGSGGAHNNTQPSTVINFIIKF
jgi:microcystin-dependent protein